MIDETSVRNTVNAKGMKVGEGRVVRRGDGEGEVCVSFLGSKDKDGDGGDGGERQVTQVRLRWIEDPGGLGKGSGPL